MRCFSSATIPSSSPPSTPGRSGSRWKTSDTTAYPLHYECEIGATHFAIHPSADWPGEASPNGQSPVIVFHTNDVNTAYEQLLAHGVNATPPFDHGFAVLIAFRDPDGNNVQILQPAQSSSMVSP